MAESFDFQINDLKFRAATSDRFPYARATAPFRKEQFDSAPTVGDQSLTGWWTRGQLSFHRGAGIKYYEVLEGDEVLNRFDDSSNTEVFTAGEVTLLPALSEAAIAATDAVPLPLALGGGIYALTDTSLELVVGGQGTPVATSNGAVPTSIESSGGALYVANGANIEYKAPPALERTNYVTNPSFEVDTVNWTTVSGSMTRGGASTRYGSYGAKITEGTDVVPVVRTQLDGLVIGEPYKVAAWVKNNNTGPGPVTETFTTAGSHSWVVPAGITEVTIEAYGASGDTAHAAGGLGAYVKGTLPVTPGETLYLQVANRTPATGGGEGAMGGLGGNGGGASDVRQGGNTLANRVLVAAGGGGGGYYDGGLSGAGGDGGITAGSDGVGPGSYVDAGGKGGTQSAGGAAGTPGGTAGSLGVGGDGSGSNTLIAAAGGGGGYYGGGGGGERAGGGGGGSSYVDPSISNVTTTAGANDGLGSISLTYGSAPPPPMTVRLQADDSPTATTVDGNYVDGVKDSEWEYLTFTRVAEATTEYLYLRVIDDSSGMSSDLDLDAVMVTESPFNEEYFDGAQPGCSWTGTPHASTSQWAVSDSGALVVLATSTDGLFNRVWWAKGRVWAVDNSGNWYTIAPAPLGQSVSAANAFWKSQQSDAEWTMTDTPGPVYLSNGYDVYEVTVGTDGSVPTLTAPRTVLQVPLGERISAITHYLGYTIMCTTSGVRLALQQDSTAIMGGLVFEGDFSAVNRVGLFDMKAYIPGRLAGRGGDTVMCVLDLSQEVAPLRPAWAPAWTVTPLSSDASGAIVDALGAVHTWAARKLWTASAATLEGEGHVLTAYHRMGTLDSKGFREALVRADGDGVIDVFQVSPEGTQTRLGSMTVASNSPTSKSATFRFAYPDPVERTALKFVLTPKSADAGPKLLGYQIKSLPAPVRQRLIKWPLMIQDVVRDRYGVSRGTREGAWTAWSELETLEENDALVTFTDHRTGETGEAFIESLELQTDTPTRGAESGFGGVGYITLRKVG